MSNYMETAIDALEAIRREKRVSVTFVDSVARTDPYAERMRDAWRQVCRSDYPAGMIPWLGEAHPGLYAELTERLPDQIQHLWEARAPFRDFEAACQELVECHRSAVQLFRTHYRSSRP
jgi:hypothetical protein